MKATNFQGVSQSSHLVDGRVRPGRAARVFYRNSGKRILDIMIVLMAAPVVLPVVALMALALWIESGAPIYRQKRLGRDGREYTMVKLRSMVHNADKVLADILEKDPEMREEWETTQKLKADPRITSLGRMLRKTSLDELPQLWNVLTGDMSIVGPRPMMPEQLPLYGDPKAYFALRPGITGLWQVSDRNNSRFDYRNTLDRSYFRGLSLSADMSIIVRTVGVMVNRTGY